MLLAVRRLLPLYHGTFLFGLACGVSIALTPLYLDGQGYEKEEIGTLALFFAFGLVSFAVPVGTILRRVGGKKTLATMLFGYATSLLLFPLMPSYAGIAAVRYFDGLFSIGVWIASETVVLSRSDKNNKGQLTSLYAVWLASGYVVGPLIATLVTRLLTVGQTFWLAAVFAVLSAVAIVLRLPAQEEVGPAPEDVAFPEPGGAEATLAGMPLLGENAGPSEIGRASATRMPLSVSALLARIKTSCFAVFSYGYFQSSVVLFLPLYLMEEKGIEKDQTIALPGLFCLGMLLFSTRVGRLGDRVGHLRVVSTFSALGTGCVLGFVYADAYWLMCLLVFLAGATFATMSPVALALVGVVTPPESLGRANSLYNTFYAIGMLMGPPISSVLFARQGGPSMLYHLAALWTVFVAFSLVFFGDDPASHRGARADPASPPRAGADPVSTGDP